MLVLLTLFEQKVKLGLKRLQGLEITDEFSKFL